MTQPEASGAHVGGARARAPHELLDSLGRLDRRLLRAVDAARVLFGPEAVADPFKGLHVSDTEVGNLLVRPPGAPVFWAGRDDREDEAGEPRLDEGSRLDWVTRTFGLSSFDVDVILIALAPDLDLRYERIYAFLQNDVTRRRPSVDLALDLLCSSPTEKLGCRVRFAPDSPLLHHALIELVPDPQQARPPLLAHAIKVDEQVVRLLLDEASLDPRLERFCERGTPTGSIETLALGEGVKRSLRSVAVQGRESGRLAQVYLQGPFAAEKRGVVEAVAADSCLPLLMVDLARAVSGDRSPDRMLRLVFRQAWFQGAVLYLDNLDALRGDDRHHEWSVLLKCLAGHGGITLLSGSLPWMSGGEGPVRVISVLMGIPDFAERRRQWRSRLDADGIAIGDEDVNTLSARFRLSAGQIAQSVVLAQEQVRWRRAGLSPADSHPASPGDRVAVEDLFIAARSQCRNDLATLTRKIEPKYRWADIVLPDDAVAQLREVCERELHRHRVMEDWGFDRKLSLGKGVNALFAGPSGTGKTMAAEIIANELGLDLYKIDLAGVVSKYIGETEKNLDRIFTGVENAILFFDEADALFGKRSEVRDSHDRYANLEISYLLQKMEQYEGITILASNLRQNLDEAFVRRLAFTIHFPFPDDMQRRHIWKRIWPAALPLGPDVDLDFLAAQFKLSGGNIKNIALASGFLAAADGGVVTMDHLRHATQREYQKLGKVLSAAELSGARGM